MASPKRTVRGNSVAVIGGAGFLSSHLIDYLIEERNCEVLVLDNLITGYKKFVHPKAKFVWYDIRDDEGQLRKILKDYRIQYLFNYAAEPYVPDCFQRPLHVFNINAFAALKVLHASQEAGVQGILQMSSAEIYGRADGKLSETTSIEPHSSYGVSKAAADGFVQVRWREAGTPAIALRQFNCYGPRETHPYIVPEIIAQVARGDGKVYLGNNSTRDFLYAGDQVRMAIGLFEKGQFGEVYNLGSEEAITIYDLAVLIGKIMKKEVEVIPDPTRVRPWEIWHLQSDNTKINNVISERPLTTMEEGLKKAVQYFLENGTKWDYE